MRCKICGAESKPFDSATILNKYEVQYYKCPDCGFIQTEEPHWLDEAYSSAITSSDIGLIQRNCSISFKLDILLRAWNVSTNKTFLDYRMERLTRYLTLVIPLFLLRSSFLILFLRLMIGGITV